ncbi:MAG: REP-associated tyrosine transposase [Bacillota bacterium]
MPRAARKQSSSGIYHAMVRGNEKKDIFHDDEDRSRFIETMLRMKEDGNYEIYAYCLMDNHVHLLIKEENDSIQRSMKRICVSYVHYFNDKYQRTGHLLQDRFRSEAVEDDRYILAVARYIHNNPVKAGLASKAEDYRWSSYQDYVNLESDKGLVERDFILSMMSDSKKLALKKFWDYTNEPSEDRFIDYIDRDPKTKLTPVEIIDNENKINTILENNIHNFESLKRYNDKNIRNDLIKVIMDRTGVSVRELSRLTGISKDTISRALTR